MPVRNNILLRERVAPKRVKLLGRQVFYAKYERAGRTNLPPNTNMRRTYTRMVGPGRQRNRKQRGQGIKTVLKKAYNLSKKAINLSLGKMLIREGLEYACTLYKKGTKKIKNKITKNALQFDLPNFVIDQGNVLLRERFK